MAQYNAIITALCAPGNLDLSSKSADIAAVRKRYPKLTNDKIAYAVSLLPASVITAAGIRNIYIGKNSQFAVAYLSGSSLVIQVADVAPAEIAAVAMFAVSVEAEQDPGAQFEPADVVKVANAIKLDTYIKIAAEHPEALQGKPIKDEGLLDKAGNRIAQPGGEFGTVSISKKIFKRGSRFWTPLVAYMGSDFYGDDPDHADSYQLQFPVPASDVETVSDAFSHTC